MSIWLEKPLVTYRGKPVIYIEDVRGFTIMTEEDVLMAANFDIKEVPGLVKRACESAHKIVFDDHSEVIVTDLKYTCRGLYVRLR